MSQLIKLSDIRYSGIQTRAKLDREAVDDYAERFVGSDDKMGTVWPPIEVYHDPIESPGIYWLGDGSHRLAAAAQLEHEEIVADVHKGGKWDAAEHQIKSNRDHGVRRTPADKRKSVEVALSHPTWGQWSDRQIAEFCGVGGHLVASVREQLRARAVEPVSEPGKRVGKDGRARKPRTKPAATTPDVGQESPAAAAVEAEPDTGADSEDDATEFDAEALEQQTVRRNGKPVISRKDRKKAQLCLGGLIRALEAMDLYEKHTAALSAIAEDLEKV